MSCSSGRIIAPETLRVKEFLTRNGHPYAYIDLDRDADVQVLLDRFHVTAADVPVLICRGEVVLRNPTNQQIADCLGFNDGHRPDPDTRRGHRRRRTRGTRGGRVRRFGRPGCPCAGDELAGRTGRFQLEDRELPLAFRRASRVKLSRGGRTRRRRNSAPK